MDAYHSAIHENLVLLTKVYPNLDMENKLQKGMFKKPSTKGMQSVFYSLMCIINPEYCRKNVPWPVEFCSDNYKFRLSIIEFINKECPDFEVPTLLPSLLNKVDGEKYVRFVFNFVTYITQKILASKFGEVTLQKPVPYVHFEESIGILDVMIASNLADFDEQLQEHANFMEKSNAFISSSVTEFQANLKEYQARKQLLCNDLKDALSFTDVTEETALECVHESYENELSEMKNRLDTVKLLLKSKLERKEYLIRLLKLRQKIRLNIFDVDTFKSNINENFAQEIQIPLSTLMSTLFVSHGDTCEIRLLPYLRYGHRVINKLILRFLKLNPTEQQLAAYKSAESLAANTVQRLEIFRALDAKLDGVIKDCKRKGLDFDVQCFGDESESLVELLLALRKHATYVPRVQMPVVEKPLQLVEFHKNADDADPIMRMKKRLELMEK